MAESDLPVTQDPGRNEGARKKWGEQILRAVSALRDEVLVNKKDISILSDLTKGLSVKIDRVEKDLGEKIDRVEKDLSGKIDQVKNELGEKIQQIHTDQAVMRTEIGYTKKWAYWALGAGVGLLIVMIRFYMDLNAQMASLSVRYDQMSDNIKQIKEDLKSMRADSRIKIEEKGNAIEELR